MTNSDHIHIRDMIVRWADAVASGDRQGILANHADDLVMIDFPNTVRGLAAYDRTWQFFDDSRRGLSHLLRAISKSPPVMTSRSRIATSTVTGRRRDLSTFG